VSVARRDPIVPSLSPTSLAYVKIGAMLLVMIVLAILTYYIVRHT